MEFTITKFFPLERDKFFTYWTTPKYLEQWSSPDGMTLKVPQLEAKQGGKYRFEHTSDNGLYVCTGYFKEFIADKKLVQIDTVKDPSGATIFQNLKSIIEFKDLGTGTDISISVIGFTDQKQVDECKTSWEQSLDRLSKLLKVELIERDQENERHDPLSP
jgi:uncharacterized protein YndB with AHSA1/START domain